MHQSETPVSTSRFNLIDRGHRDDHAINDLFRMQGPHQRHFIGKAIHILQLAHRLDLKHQQGPVVDQTY